MPRILLVEDDPVLRSSVERCLKKKGLEIVSFTSGFDALKAAERKVFHLLLADLRIPDMDGMDLIRAFQKFQPQASFVVMTGYGSVGSAVDAMKLGAFHYLTKPFDVAELEHLVMRALEHSHLKTENRLYKQQLVSKYRFENMIGEHSSMMEIFRLIEKVSGLDSTVLITGESGTGKELVARAIHYNSPRLEKPMVAVNCAALPEELLESELFGHVKGAFTGATSHRQGMFEVAHGGTIFLDEVGDMSPRLQVKLLRVLQERKFNPVGGESTLEVDVRIITATNKNLEKGVEEGQFREDLYYRLNVFPIHLPPLRQHQSDIPLLLKYFLDKFNQDKKRNVSGFSDECVQIFLAYPWPGNIRELENLVERMVILKEKGEITAKDLPLKYFQATNRKRSLPRLTLPDFGLNLREVLDGVEEDLILQALHKTQGNRNKAAALLKLKRTTLVEKIKRWKKVPPDSSSTI